jgi:hypothetical protein
MRTESQELTCTRRCWPWWWPTSRSTETFSSIARRSGRAPPTCARWPTGSSSARSKRSSWNRPRSIGVRFGRHWSCTGGRSAGRARARARSAGRSTSHKRSRIAEPVAGRQDFPDAERLVKRLVAQELTLSFVPDAEQRLWRTVMRRKYQITRNRVQLHSRLESLLEEAHQAVQPRLRSAGHQRPTHAAGPRRWRDRPRLGGVARRPAPPRDSRSIVRRHERGHDAASGVSSAAAADARGIAIDREAPRRTPSTDGRPPHRTS